MLRASSICRSGGLEGFHAQGFCHGCIPMICRWLSSCSDRKTRVGVGSCAISSSVDVVDRSSFLTLWNTFNSVRGCHHWIATCSSLHPVISAIRGDISQHCPMRSVGLVFGGLVTVAISSCICSGGMMGCGSFHLHSSLLNSRASASDVQPVADSLRFSGSGIGPRILTRD